MTNSILLSMNVDDIKSLISDCISEQFRKFSLNSEIQDDQLIKIDEVAKMLNVSKVTIFAWKKAGKIPFYRISRKVYFKRNEVLDSMKKIEKREI